MRVAHRIEALASVLECRGAEASPQVGLRDQLAEGGRDPRRARVVVATHNVHDFPETLREWAEAGRSHHGCILSFVPTNAYGEMSRRFERWFRRFPGQSDWVDRVVAL